MPGLDRINIVPNQAFINALEAQGARELYNKLEHSLRGEVITVANRIINEDFSAGEKNNPVGPKKTRNVRQARRHLAGSITVEVKWNSKTLPVNIIVHSSADPHKVGALEFGTDAKHPGGYEIKGNPFLLIPWENGYVGKRKVKAGGKSKPATLTKSVHHPGVKGRHFMQRALEEVLATRLNL